MSRAAWSVFWASESGTGCLTSAPPAVLSRLTNEWQAFAATLSGGAEVLDVAAGAGAVMRCLRAARDDIAVRGVDYAEIGRGAEPGIAGNVDAAALPFADASFDGVVSQFGIEYCPPAAATECLRVLRPGGTLRFVCHHANGEAVSHNRARLAAVTALREAGLFELADAAARGRAEDAGRAAAVAAARRDHAAQSIVEELPLALGQALRRPGAAAAVVAIRSMAMAEMARLTAMSAAALDAAGAERLARLLSAGAAVTVDTIAVDGEPPIAWSFGATRGG